MPRSVYIVHVLGPRRARRHHRVGTGGSAISLPPPHANIISSLLHKTNRVASGWAEDPRLAPRWVSSQRYRDQGAETGPRRVV